MGKDASEQTLFYEGDATEQVKGTVQDKQDDIQRESEPRDEHDLGRAKSWGRGGKGRTRSTRKSSKHMDEILHDADDAFKDEIQQETPDLSDAETRAIEVDATSAPVSPLIQETVMHQRAKALGLPDTLEAHTPTPTPTAQDTFEEGAESMQFEGEMKQMEDSNSSEALMPFLQEAALHQRAKALGLPDEPSHMKETSMAQEPPTLERQEEIALPVSLPEAKMELTEQKAFDKDVEETLHKRQDSIALAPNEDPLVALDPEVVTLHVREEKVPLSERIGEKFEGTAHVLNDKAHVINEKIGEKAHIIKNKLLERRNSLEEAGHNARVKIDAALEKKFGYQAEKIQTEFEKARLSAINDTAHIAELLQQQLRHGAADLREQQQARMVTADPLLADEKEPAHVHEPSGSLPFIGENVVAQRFLDLEHNLEYTGCLAREKIDTALERKFGPKVEEILLETEKAKDLAIDETARAVETLEVQVGKCVSSFRDQLVHGPTPNYH